MTVCLDQHAAYRNRVEALAQTGPAWSGPLRNHALNQFQSLGYPTTRQEAWRFTNPRALERGEFQPAPEAEVTQAQLAPYLLHGEAHRIVLVNGRYQANLSHLDASDVSVLPLAAALTAESELLKQHLSHHADDQNEALTALNTALFEDGVVVHAKTTAERPVHLLHVSVPDAAQPRLSSPRTLVVAEAGADVTLLQTFISIGDAAAWTNTVTEIVVGAEARVRHLHKVLENDNSYHTLALAAVLSDHSHFESHGMLLGGALVRNDTRVTFNGSHAQAALNGLYMGRDSQVLDNHITVNHAKPHNQSNQFYKGILDGKSRGVFSGTVVVAQDAQKTDASQVNRNLLLSDDARVDAMPRLEIYADDVKCAHGATTGQIDEDALFYLQSRGIDKDSAYDLLIYAFAHELIEKMPLDAVRQQAEAFLLERFAKAAMIGE